MSQTKKCSKCGEIKPLSEFYKSSTRKNGHQCLCKTCDKKGNTERYRADPIGMRDKARVRASKNIHRRRATSALSSHSLKGHIINISVDEVEHMFSTTTHCPICGVKMLDSFGNGRKIYSPSLDRIDNGTELTKDNLWIICSRCNVMKGDQTMHEYIERSHLIYEKFKDVF